jgi:hypothetical protein
MAPHGPAKSPRYLRRLPGRCRSESPGARCDATSATDESAARSFSFDTSGPQLRMSVDAAGDRTVWVGQRGLHRRLTATEGLGRHARLGPTGTLVRMATEGVPEGAVPYNCPNCDVSVVVFPSSVLGQVNEKTGSVEEELAFAASLADYRDGTERRYSVADVGGASHAPLAKHAARSRSQTTDLGRHAPPLCSRT